MVKPQPQTEEQIPGLYRPQEVPLGALEDRRLIASEDAISNATSEKPPC